MMVCFQSNTVVQRRLLVMNELYKRAEVNPEMAYSYHKNIAMIEWGADPVEELVGEEWKEHFK